MKEKLLTAELDKEWETCFNHDLKGPIINISESPNNELIQFAVLYRNLENDDLKYYVRIYYFPNKNSIQMEYKDIMLPGTTTVNMISLEDDYILFHR